MPRTDDRLRVFGIRHHGPGSARSLRAALAEWRPDLVLIEGPPDANALLPRVGEPGLEPPVALVIYDQAEPQRCAFYPFAVFSPEWQALLHARENGVPARFIDLPQSLRLATRSENGEGLQPDRPPHDKPADPAEMGDLGKDELDDLEEIAKAAERPKCILLRRPPDPLQLIAEATGHGDGERLWDHLVESRTANAKALAGKIFEAIRELMHETRQAIEDDLAAHGVEPDPEEARREAYMRQEIRAALKQADTEGWERIAVVCGAWHVSALREMPTIKHDRELLKGLRKVKTGAAWVPWTYERLASASGYGAGVDSPEWYHLLFTVPDEAPIGEEGLREDSVREDGVREDGVREDGVREDGVREDGVREDGAREDEIGDDSPSPNDPKTEIRGRGVVQWATRAARLLRGEDLDASTASVIETVRLAEALAALRDLHQPRLEELDEAVRTVLCFGQNEPMQQVHQRLMIGERLGRVPESAPTVPLVHDLQTQQKRLRLKPVAEAKTVDLDLRKENGRARSHLLHRLNLLDTPWGTKSVQDPARQSTFRETWQLKWRPEIYIELVDAARFGSTLEDAAAGKVSAAAAEAEHIEPLVELLDDALLAELPRAVERLIRAIERRSAVSGDVLEMMQALPPLARQCRHGSVRQSDATMVEHAVDGLVARTCVGLGPACAALDDDAARTMFRALNETQGAIELLQKDTHRQPWREALRLLGERSDVHRLVSGRAWRLLHESRVLAEGEAANRLSRELSPAVSPKDAADWLEGFLAGSGALLLHDETLWAAVDAWIRNLGDDAFIESLPPVRRTFATFSISERRSLAAKAARAAAEGSSHVSRTATPATAWNAERVELVLPILQNLLGPMASTDGKETGDEPS